MLQNFGGSEQVGYFGFSHNIVIIVSTLTTALVPVIHREFSEAFARSKMKEIKELFLKYVPKVFIFVTFVNVFCAVELEKIVTLMGGSSYQQSLQPGLILLLTSIINPIILLSSALLLSTDHTKEIRNITLFKVIIGLFAAYILISPKNYFGFGLGAIGLAVKITVVQVYSLIMYLFFVSKYLGFSLIKFIIKTTGSAFILFSIGFLITFLFDYNKNKIGLITSFLLDGAIYTILSAIIISCLPGLFFLEKNELSNYAKRGISKIKLLYSER
jgi:O-antigen/teichoic acid export membrane protein